MNIPGYAGKILYIDLESQSVKVEELEEAPIMEEEEEVIDDL